MAVEIKFPHAALLFITGLGYLDDKKLFFKMIQNNRLGYTRDIQLFGGNEPKPLTQFSEVLAIQTYVTTNRSIMSSQTRYINSSINLNMSKKYYLYCLLLMILSITLIKTPVSLGYTESRHTSYNSHNISNCTVSRSFYSRSSRSFNIQILRSMPVQ